MKYKIILILMGVIVVLLKLFFKEDKKIYKNTFDVIFNIYGYVAIAIGIYALILLLMDLF